MWRGKGNLRDSCYNQNQDSTLTMTGRTAAMKTNDTRIALSGILPILAIVCAGFLTATAASGETYREAMQEAERESIHQN